MTALLAIWPLAKRFWWLLPLLALALWGWRVDSLRAHYKAGWESEKAAFAETVANYRTASDLAQRAAQANVERVKVAQEQITKETEDALQDRVADTQRAYDRLLAQARADKGGAGETGVPGPGATPCFPDGTPCSDAVLATLKAAEDNTNRLIGLQDWVRQTSSIPVVAP